MPTALLTISNSTVCLSKNIKVPHAKIPPTTVMPLMMTAIPVTEVHFGTKFKILNSWRPF
jgi:hypothetical protein